MHKRKKQKKTENARCIFKEKGGKGHRGWSNGMKKELYQSNLKRPIEERSMKHSTLIYIHASTTPSLFYITLPPPLFSVASCSTLSPMVQFGLGSVRFVRHEYCCASQAIALIATTYIQSLGTLSSLFFFSASHVFTNELVWLPIAGSTFRYIVIAYHEIVYITRPNLYILVNRPVCLLLGHHRVLGVADVS